MSFRIALPALAAVATIGLRRSAHSGGKSNFFDTYRRVRRIVADHSPRWSFAGVRDIVMRPRLKA
jgi:hypothetical protein